MVVVDQINQNFSDYFPHYEENNGPRFQADTVVNLQGKRFQRPHKFSQGIIAFN